MATLLPAAVSADLTAPTRWPDRDALAWPLAGLAMAVILHFDLALNRAINWDEFFHYSQLHQFAAGNLSQPLQTLQARLFRWVIDLPGNSIDHLRVLRMFGFAAVIGAAGCIYAVARRFCGASAAATCALLYLTAGFVLQHGSSFRADPWLALLLTGALALLLHARLTPPACLAAGVLLAAAALFSIKVVLYAPAFAGIALLRWAEAGWSRSALLRLMTVGASAGIAFAALYLWHSSSGLAADANIAAERVVTNSSRKMFALGGLPYYYYIFKCALVALPLTAAVLYAPVRIARESMTRYEKIALAGLLLPITVVAVYHNTAPYFYTFILAPVAAGCAPGVIAIARRIGLGPLCALACAGAGSIWLMEDRATQSKQHRLLAAADEIFERPVAYFDFPAMLGTYPKANHFMTPWGQESYLAGSAPVMTETMARIPVPLVVEIEPMFTNLLRGRGQSPDFQPKDAVALRGNYIHFWGPYWVAGKNVAVGEHRTEFLVPGPYTVTGAAVTIDGRRHRPGEVVELERQTYRLSSVAPAQLVWGRRLRRPADAPPPPPYWAEF